MAKEATKNRTKGGYPTVAAALRRVAAEADPEGQDIHRITIRLLASGEIAYRLHDREEQTYVGGVVSVDE